MSIRPGDQVTGKRPGSINVRHPELQSLFRMEMASATKVIMNQANQLTRRRTRGIVWVPLDSGHIGSFDRRKCKGPLSGPGAEKGEKCPEGWSFYPLPGPPLQGDSGAAENPYYVWVDQHDILGFDANTPIATGN
jgi:hypothetical protein